MILEDIWRNLKHILRGKISNSILLIGPIIILLLTGLALNTSYIRKSEIGIVGNYTEIETQIFHHHKRLCQTS